MPAKRNQRWLSGPIRAKAYRTVWLRIVLSLATSIASAGGHDAPSPAAVTGEVVWLEDFESGWGDWYPDYGIWQIGEPTSGPGGAHQGRGVAATVLGGDYPGYQDSRLISPVIALPMARGDERIQLRLWHWFSYSSYDSGTIQISVYDAQTGTWGGWTNLVVVSGVSAVWSPVKVDLDLTAYAGQCIQIGFLHSAERNSAGWSSESSGWYLDEVEIWKGIPVWANPEGFECGWGDWHADNGVWEIGKPTYGPPTTLAGRAVAGTVLGGSYPGYQDSRLVSPATTLPTVAGEERVQLRFWQWFSYSSYDSGTIQISVYDANTPQEAHWTDLATVKDTSGVWSPMHVDLTAYAGHCVRIAFLHTAERNAAGWASESSGWYLDEVELWKGVPTFVNPETFEFGWGDWYADSAVWEIGRSDIVPPSFVSGGDCGGTVLNGSYPGYTDSRLVSPVFQMPALSVLSPGVAMELRFWHWFSYSTYDSGTIQIRVCDPTTGGYGDWSALASINGVSAVWSPMRISLSAYAGQRVQIAFLHTAERNAAGWASESSGWYIDDVQISPPPETWVLSEDTGCSRTDKVTHDTTPELAFVFPQTVYGVDDDIQITNPDGLRVVPNAISGWGSNMVVVTFTTPLGRDGQYAVTLKGTISDSKGKAIHDDADVAVYFTLDTTPPRITVDPLATEDTTPPLTGTVDDPDARIEVICNVAPDANAYTARNNGNGTWILPDNVITPAPAGGIRDVLVTATDRAGNTISLRKFFDPVPDPFGLTISVVGRGSIVEPNVEKLSYPTAQVVRVTAVADPNFAFVRWRGTAAEAGKTEVVYQDEAGSEINVTVDGWYTVTAVFEEVIHEEPLDADPGWTRNGQWEFGIPTGRTCDVYGGPDPTSGHTGQNVMGVNLNGCYDPLTGGPYAIIAGPFDLTGYEDVKLRFWRWLNSDWPEYVRSTVEVSTDGHNWSLVWEQPGRQEITDSQWTSCEYPIPQADSQPAVYLRWSYQVVQERAYAYTGWNIDDIQLIGKPHQ